MTPFNPNAKCPKCGGGEVGSVYRSSAESVVDRRLRKTWPEHIERRCLTCGYSWPEAPMDATDE